MYSYMEALTNFDICHKGIALLGRDLSRQTVNYSLSSFPYFVPLESFTLPPTQKPKPISWALDGEPGMGEHIRIAPDASTIGFLHSKLVDVYNSRLYMTSIDSLDAFDVFDHITSIDDKEHDPPSAFEFAGRSDEIIMQSGKSGRVVLSHLKLHDGEKPKFLTSEGSAGAFYPLEEGNWDTLLVSSTNFTDSSLWETIGVSEAGVTSTVSSSTKKGAKFGISSNMVSDIWFEGVDDVCVQSFMVRPSDFDENKKYPWMFLPHGGPISVWSDAWSWRVRD